MQMARASLVSLVLATANAEGSQMDPLGKTLQLLSELSTKVKQEGEIEGKAYQEFFQWCDNAARTSRQEIETGTSLKAKLEAQVSESTASISGSEAKIADLVASIAKGSDELKEATQIRKKENADFKAAEKELLEVIDTLGRAIGILEREMAKNPAAFAQFEKTGSQNLAGVIDALSAVVDAAAFSANDKQTLIALVQADEDDDGLGAPAANVYKTHSTDITGVLEDMKEKSESQLSDLRSAEATASHNYDMVAQALNDKLADEKRDLKEEKSSKASSAEEKATAEGDLAACVKELAADKKRLETTQGDCMQTAAEHEASIRGRAEEVKVIAQAIKVLQESTSGAPSFVQAAASVSRSGHVKVANDVRELAKKYHSAALAQLASRINSVFRMGTRNSDDPFVKVRGLIEAMIRQLDASAQDEAAEKAYCDEQLMKTEAKKAELEDDESKLSTKIQQAESKSAQLTEQVKDLQGELAELAKEQADMDKLRANENANFIEAKNYLQSALAGVRKAIGMLRDYYSGGSAASLLQDDAGFTAGMQQPVVPSHSKAEGAGSSIIGILEVVESDFAKELTNEVTTESESAAEYAKVTQENAVDKTQKDQSVKYKTQEIKSLQKALSQLGTDHESTSTELAAVNEYLAKLKDRCIAKPETYEERKARREAELAGLKEALRTLEGQEAFVQRRKRSGNMRGGAISVE